jgi:RNA polymerase sigma-70 factor, ECF subfamily
MAKQDPGSTSTSLLKLATDLDENAWKRLLDEYRPWIARICERTGIASDDVDDVIQDILRSVVPSIGGFRSNGKGSFRRWLYTITQRSAIDFHRVNGRTEQASGGTTAPNQMAEFFDDASLSTQQAFLQSSSAVDHALALVERNCSRKTWKAFWLMTVDGWSSREIGEELAMTETAVRLAKLRVLSKLKQKLSEQNVDIVSPQPRS